jgi:hypothetical protein
VSAAGFHKLFLHFLSFVGLSLASQSASCVLFVDNVQVGTLENSLPISLTIPSVAVPVLPIFSEDGGFLTLQIPNSTRDTETMFELFFVDIINFIDNNIIFHFQNLFEMTQNIVNEVKCRKVDLEQFKKEKVASEEKLADEDASEEDTQRLLEFIGSIPKKSRSLRTGWPRRLPCPLSLKRLAM